jgi:hypothetical protein
MGDGGITRIMTSQIDFDSPPLYDAILNPLNRNTWSSIWIGYWSSFYQTLISYLSQNGIFLPQLTTDERDLLDVDTLVNGQMIYNITTNAPQFWQFIAPGPGVWRTFLFV